VSTTHNTAAPALTSKGKAQRQRQRIEAARRLLGPSAVELHKVPNWFRLAYVRAFRLSHNGASGWNVIDHLQRHLGRGGWLDHFGKGTYRGRPAFISEPYGVDLADIEKIAELAAVLGCEYEINPNSFWFPGATTRIAFYQQEADDQVDDQADEGQ
jgi:hypothetical protein